MAAKKKKRSRRLGGLGGTQSEHEDRARDALLKTDEAMSKADRLIYRGDCEGAFLSLGTALLGSGRAAAHYDEARSTQGMVASDRVRRLEHSLYAPDSGLFDNLSRIRNIFEERCVITKSRKAARTVALRKIKK